MASSVLIVDDHGPFRAWARVWLEQAGYAVVGEAAVVHRRSVPLAAHLQSWCC